MEISDSGYEEVKSLIIEKLLEGSLIFTLIMIAITFGVLFILHYLIKGIKWTKKYSN